MNNNNFPNNDKNNNQPKMPKFNMNWIYGIIIFTLFVLFITGGGDSLAGGSASQVATYTQFKTYIDKGFAKNVVVNKNSSKLKMYVKEKNIQDVFHVSAKQIGSDPFLSVDFGSIDELEKYLNTVQGKGLISGFSYENKDDNTLMNILLGLLPWIILFGLTFWLMRRMTTGGNAGGVFNVGKSKAKLFEKGTGNVTFKDVAGQEGAKQEVQEVVDFLKNSKKYTRLGGKIPKGVLLVGPPGTGKTLLAKAVANEANVPFFSMSGSDFVEMFVGVGASRVRDVFNQAKEKAPSIIFIDEIDAIGRARSKNPQMGGNDERENTLNALLTEMDGFGTNSGVIVMAATNRVDMLDNALLRAGRFDRQIHVDLPDLQERKEIFKVHLRKVKINETVDIDYLARQTPGFSGADIANVCNEAALIAARHNSKSVSKNDFSNAVDRIVGGLEKRTKVMTRKEKQAIAIHEAGHATISWFCEHANPLVKVSIVPRGQALGAAWYLPEERQITTKEELLDQMCALLGGRAAEDLFIGHVSTGAINDLERATKSTYGMVAFAGMSSKLPNISYYNNQEYQFQKPYSETTAKIIDDEVLKTINEQYERAKKILSDNKEGHHLLAKQLMEKEVVYAEDVEKIFGKRLWVSRSEEIMQENERLKEQRLKEMPEVKSAIEDYDKNHRNTEEANPEENAETTSDEHAENRADWQSTSSSDTTIQHTDETKVS